MSQQKETNASLANQTASSAPICGANAHAMSTTYGTQMLLDARYPALQVLTTLAQVAPVALMPALIALILSSASRASLASSYLRALAGVNALMELSAAIANAFPAVLPARLASVAPHLAVAA